MPHGSCITMSVPALREAAQEAGLAHRCCPCPAPPARSQAVETGSQAQWVPAQRELAAASPLPLPPRGHREPSEAASAERSEARGQRGWAWRVRDGGHGLGVGSGAGMGSGTKRGGRPRLLPSLARQASGAWRCPCTQAEGRIQAGVQRPRGAQHYRAAGQTPRRWDRRTTPGAQSRASGRPPGPHTPLGAPARSPDPQPRQAGS